MERTKIQITDTYRCFLRILTGTAHAHTVRVRKLIICLYHLYLYVFGQWTVVDSGFLKSLTGTARTCGTREKFRNFTVHYCPLSICMGGGGGGCFQEYSRVPCARSTHEMFIFYPTPTPTSHGDRVL